MPRLTAAILALTTVLLPACDPCELRIVQASPHLGLVRVHNDCPAAIASDDKVLCAGSGGGYETCIPLGDEDAPLEAGACVDIPVELFGMMQPAGAASLGVFTVDQDPATSVPRDQVAWGTKALYLGDAGAKTAPVVESLTVAKSLTRGEEGWYEVDSGPVMTACGTWSHTISPGKRVCLPRIVEVHPGPHAFFKVAMPAGCPEKDMSEFHIAWGAESLVEAIPLPAKSLTGDECLTVGGPKSTSVNGWAQWGWDMLEPIDLAAIEPITDGKTSVQMAGLLWGGEANNGIIWGTSEVPGALKWPNLDALPIVVPPGRSLRWDGGSWAIGPTSANQCPRWVFEE